MTCWLRWCGRNRNQCRIPIWRTFGRIQWHVIPEPRVTLQSVRIPSAILKIVFRHILFLLLLMQFRLWRAAAFVSSPIHLFCIRFDTIHVRDGHRDRQMDTTRRRRPRYAFASRVRNWAIITADDTIYTVNSWTTNAKAHAHCCRAQLC